MFKSDTDSHPILMNMMITSHAGRVHEGKAIQKMLADSGFDRIRCARLKTSPC